MRIVLLLICITLLAATHSGYGQWVLVPVQKEVSEKQISHSKTKTTDPVMLPFWDDFSSVRNGVADETLWETAASVWVNDGMGINPPSLNVATFDGLDETGKPYNVNDILAKGFADELVSAPIRMDLLGTAERSRIFLSFFYQFHGNGEPPDEGDKILLSFKNNAGVWEEIWSKENDGTLLKDKFEQLTIPITDERFFHEGFQFKIQNFARLSGPYDTWHVDYVYINNGKLQIAPTRPLFPDRAISSKLSSTFTEYWSMPIRHFFSDITANATKPSVLLTNLRTDQVTGLGQPISYSSSVKISVNKDDDPPVITSAVLDNNESIGSALDYNVPHSVSLNTLPDFASLDQTADSIHIDMNVVFDTGDDKIKTPTEGDYDFDVFTPIKFRNNDSITTSYSLSTYYAYDDGTAEYGAGLNQPGAQLAYEFTLRTTEPDTIVAVDIYFPRFGDESNQVIQFFIWKELSNNASDILYQQSIPIQRNTRNKFWRIPLIDNPAPVAEKVFIGWKQNSSATIAVGLDKNSDTGSKIFSNINGTWAQNQTLKGSLMIRPVFGKGNGKGTKVGVIESADRVALYPNPSQGNFRISSEIESLEIYNSAGQKIEFTAERNMEFTEVTLQRAERGMYVARLFVNKRWVTKKILVN